MGKAGEIGHVDLAGHQRAAAAALFGTSSYLMTRALLSGLERSVLSEQAGGLRQRWVAARPARRQRHLGAYCLAGTATELNGPLREHCLHGAAWWVETIMVCHGGGGGGV